MSLVDRTNETINLSLERDFEGNGDATLLVDADFDSSFTPAEWVWMTATVDDGFSIRLTYKETGLLHDRLGRILGVNS